MTDDDLPVHEFASAAAFDSWLTDHHATSRGVWLRIARKGAAATTVTYPEAVEVALCHGWIDGKRKGSSPDDGFYLQRMTPRGARSRWSRINRDKAVALVASGRMQPAGLGEVERAKADGRWAAAYESQRNATPPPDLVAALDAEPAARSAFERLDALNRYAIIYRVGDAKRPETRARRIADYVAMLARGETVYTPRRRE